MCRPPRRCPPTRGTWLASTAIVPGQRAFSWCPARNATPVSGYWLIQLWRWGSTCSIVGVSVVGADIDGEGHGPVHLGGQRDDPGAGHDVLAAVVDRLELDLHVAGPCLAAAPLVDDLAGEV